MSYIVRLTAEYMRVSDGVGGVGLGQAQADVPGFGASIGPGEVGMAQRLIMRVAEPVAGGDSATNTAFQNALNAGAADLYTRFTTAASEPGYTAGTPFSVVQGWATGQP